jgi:DNA-binding LacI/PurR family transcriptional regulator
MVTLKDIAKKAGVNISTVSKALNDNKEISRGKREEIKRIAEELNYSPNISARTLVGKGSNSIGVIFPEIRSNYYAKMFYYIQNELEDTNFSLIMATTNFELANEKKYIQVFSTRRVDGIVLVASMNKEIENTLNSILKKHHIPFLFIESFIKSKTYDYITIDNRYGVDLAVGYFHKLGFTNIGFICETLSAHTRHKWFIEALEKRGLVANMRHIKNGEERFELGGYLRMQELLAEPDCPNAVFVSYDHMAIGAMKAIYDKGLRIPEDISLIGFDNIRESEFLIKPLTTVAPPIKEMVGIGIKTLLDKIEHKEKKVAQHISLHPELIVRESTIE